MPAKTKKSPVFVPCCELCLPPELAAEGMRCAAAENPANVPPAAGLGALPVARVAMLTAKYWGPKGLADVGVQFLEQTAQATKTKILAFANKWGQYGNIRYRETTQTGDVRLTLAGGGYASYVGTDNRAIPSTQPTMWLQGFTASTSDAEYDRVVTHEFGHQVGLIHEHKRPDLVKKLDPQKAIKYYRQTQGWTQQQVIQQVLSPENEAELTSTPVEDTSVMCYTVPGTVTYDGKSIPGGSKITASDGAFVARQYPKPDVPVTPPTTDPSQRIVAAVIATLRAEGYKITPP